VLSSGINQEGWPERTAGQKLTAVER
jgi:hypothetical protein